MFEKLIVFLFITFALSFSQNEVGLSGMVLDSYTKNAVEGARVRVVRQNMTSSTDMSGSFTIEGTSVRTKRLARTSPILQFQGPKGFRFINQSDVNVTMQLYDLSGKQGTVLFSGKLNTGVWQFFPPQLAHGVYICQVTTLEENFTATFVASGNRTHKGTLNLIKTGEIKHGKPSRIMAKENIHHSVFDSLEVTKNGYFPTVVPLDNIFKSGLEIFLTDTTTGRKAIIIPDSSWTCGMPDGIVPPEQGELVFRATLKPHETHDMGITPYGFRTLFIINEGTVSGDRIDAKVLSGGMELELRLPNGNIELEQIHVLKTSDNTLIYMRNGGVAPAGDPVVRVVPDFEAPDSSAYAWLNSGKFAATRIIDIVTGIIHFDVYDISKVDMSDPLLKLRDPEGLPNQPWDCLSSTGDNDEELFSLTLSFGTPLTIGTSKRVSRTVIPITGGTVSGRITGSILAGGAVFTGISDARFSLIADNGELVLVRNCGTAGVFVPFFEARTDGPYVYLNSNIFLCSVKEISDRETKFTMYLPK